MTIVCSLAVSLSGELVDEDRVNAKKTRGESAQLSGTSAFTCEYNATHGYDRVYLDTSSRQRGCCDPDAGRGDMCSDLAAWGSAESWVDILNDY